MAWFSFGGDDIGKTLRSIDTRLTNIEGTQMTQNEDLAQIKADLAEAATEVVAKIEELTAAVEAGQPVDPQLLADVKALAANLADIVPDAEVPPAE